MSSQQSVWRLIRDIPRPPLVNMLLDELLLRQLDAGQGLPTLRLYRWDRETISLGRFQDPTQVLDLEALREADIPWVHRPSGGKLVFHGPDLTYSVVAPKTGLGAAGELFRRVHTAWAEALRRTGLAVDLASREWDGLGTPDCFSTQVPHEVLYEGSKVLGSAQRVSRRAILQHGSLLTRRDAGVLGQLLHLRPEHLPAIRPFDGTWTPADFLTAEALFLEEFARMFHAKLQEQFWTAQELSAVS